MLEAVEELRGAGAEAMQIAGASGPAVRIVASTYFADGAGGLVVDGQTLPAPYTLTVIGPAATMQTALMIPGGVADAVARDGGTLHGGPGADRSGWTRCTRRRRSNTPNPYSDVTRILVTKGLSGDP